MFAGTVFAGAGEALGVAEGSRVAAGVGLATFAAVGLASAPVSGRRLGVAAGLAVSVGGGGVAVSAPAAEVGWVVFRVGLEVAVAKAAGRVAVGAGASAGDVTAAGGVVAVSAGAGAGRLAKTTAKPMRVTTASKAMNPSNTQVSVGSDLAPVDGVLRIISNGQPVIDPQRLAISVQQLWQAGFHKSNGSLFARPKHNQ